MTSLGPISGALVEVEFLPIAGWSDITPWVNLGQGIKVTSGRATEFSDISAGTLTLTFFNDSGSFTPDNPLSGLYPYVVEGKRIRVTVKKSGVSYQRYIGNITSWAPSWPDAHTNSGIVTVTAADVYAPLTRHTLRSQWHEEAAYQARNATSWCDGFVLSATAATAGTAFENYGTVAAGGAAGTAVVIPAYTGVGALTFGADTAVMLESAASFQPVTNSGFTVRCKPQPGCTQLEFWIMFPAGTAAPPIALGVLDLWARSASLGSLRLRSSTGVPTLALYDNASNLVGDLWPVADGVWRRITLQSNAGTPTTMTAYVNGIGIWSMSNHDLRGLTHAYFGGGTNYGLEGKSTNCATFSMAAPVFSGTRASVNNNYVVPNQPVWTTGTRSTQWRLYVSDLVGAVYSTGSDSGRTIANSDWTGVTPAEAAQRIQRSAGGAFWVDPLGAATFIQPDKMRPSVPMATIHIEGDVSAPPSLSRSVDSRPTRVVVTYPGGTVTAIDTAAEASNALRRDGTLDTDSASADAALSVGSGQLYGTSSLRITQISVDLATSTTDLWGSFLGVVGALANLRPGVRVRVTGLQTAIFGVSWMDVYVQGWTETYTPDSSVLTFDCTPADAPTEGIWGDAEYGRFAADGTTTVTSGTAVGTTATGTVVITTTGTPWSTSAGDYPMDLDWAGERVTITAAPGSSTSPQTLTITARGVAPTVARAHVAGDPVDAWHSAAFAP